MYIMVVVSSSISIYFKTNDSNHNWHMFFAHVSKQHWFIVYIYQIMSPISIPHDTPQQNRIFKTITNQSITYSLAFEAPCTNPQTRLTYCPSKLLSSYCLFGWSKEKATWCSSTGVLKLNLSLLVTSCPYHKLHNIVLLYKVEVLQWYNYMKRRRYNSKNFDVNSRLSHFWAPPLPRWMPHLTQQFTFVGYECIYFIHPMARGVCRLSHAWSWDLRSV